MFRFGVMFVVLFTAANVFAQQDELSDSASMPVSDPLSLLLELPAIEVVAQNSVDARNYELGLGAMQKRGGTWRFKRSERVSASRNTLTVQIVDGYTLDEILVEVLAGLGKLESLYHCDGRDCGNPVQWANRVFKQRILYGRDDFQRYRVYRMTNGDYLVVYGGARTSARQYLHLEHWRPAQSEVAAPK